MTEGNPAGDERLQRASRIVELAWRDLPVSHRALLEAIGANGREVVGEPLGGAVDDRVHSAGFAELDEPSYEAAVARVVWHEWGHALSVVRSHEDDIAAGPRLLRLAPKGVSGSIRSAGYRSRDYTHELVAETYALLMSRRRRGLAGQPPWLDDEIYKLVRRVTDWSE